MTRQTRTLVLLGAAVAVCAAGYAALRLWNQRQAEADDAVHLTTLTQATSFSFTNQNGDFSFTQSQEEGWQRTDDPDFPADQDALDSLVNQALSLTAVRTISDPEGLSSYGLDDPQLTLTLSDGTDTFSLLVGDAFDSYYYAQVSGQGDTVYTISTELPAALDVTLDDLMALAQFPVLSQDNITSLTWTSAQANLTLECETVEAEADSGDASTDSSADSETETTQVWLANGVEVDQSNADFISLMAQMSQLSFSGCYDYHGQAQTRTDCGLDDPTGVLTVSYGDGQTMTLTLGALDETGSAWYALLDEDPIIYLIQSKTISTLTGLSAPYFAEE